MTTPREHPILFSGAMVRAILEGRKTQTRRVLVPQPCGGIRASVFSPSGIGHPWAWLRSPYGHPGDRLWVRETWANPAEAQHLVLYRADYPQCVPAHVENVPPVESIRWSPSIYMRRIHSRITLEVTEVRVQQLQDITEDDARAEGAEPEWRQSTDPAQTYRGGFMTLWDSINGRRGFSWDKNPWVWAITFRNITEQARAGAAA